MSIDKSYRKAAINLKKLGLIDYDLRYRLSTEQSAQIRQLEKEYRQVIKFPDRFHIATVGINRALELDQAGFKVTPSLKAIIPLHDYETANITKSGIVLRKGRHEERIILANSKNFFKELKKLSETKLPRNSMITARIGNNQFFSRAKFGSYSDLYHYVFNVFDAKDHGESTKRLQGLMSVVTLHGPNSNNILPPKKRKKNGKKTKG